VIKGSTEPNELSSDFEWAEFLGDDRWKLNVEEDTISFWERLPNHPDWVVQATFQSASHNPAIQSLAIHAYRRWAPPAGLETDVLRSVRLGELQRKVWAKVHTDDVIKKLDIGHRRTASDRVPRRPRGGHNDLYYARWARRYVIARKHPSPVQRLSKRHHLSVSQIRNILYEARQRELLTDSPKGKAGGDLTEKATALLEKGRR
jgi:hypothetical protein